MQACRESEKATQSARAGVAWTIVGEFIMVDVRVARAIPQGTRLHRACEALAARQKCGVISSTFVVDFLEADAADRAVLLDVANWPEAT